MMEAPVMLRPQLLCILLLVLAGCDATDPYLRQGVWRPNGANEANLRAMVVSPSDLVRGVDSSAGDGRQAAAALDRLRNDKPRLLPDSAVAKVVPISSGSQGSQ
jgi:type IV pilus biogenesis protein CpaD/CtpE